MKGNMIHPEVKKLVVEVFGCFREDKVKLAEECPEACLVSLLESIKEDLPTVSTTLYGTIQRSTFAESVEEAKQRLGLQKAQQARFQFNHAGKDGKKRVKLRHLEKVGA